MKKTSSSAYTAFDGFQGIARGSLAIVTLAVQHAIDDGSGAAILIFDNATGYPIEIDSRGRRDAVMPAASKGECGATEIPGAHVSATADALADESSCVGRRGRPKLGVVSREIRLLLRQWAWPAAQPGGASARVARASGGTFENRFRHCPS